MRRAHRASSGHDQRAFRSFEQSGRAVQVGTRRCRARFRAAVQLADGLVSCLAQEDVVRDLDIDRPLGRRRGAPPCIGEDQGICSALSARPVHDQRRERGGLVGRLVQVASPLSDALEADLARDDHERDEGGERLHQRSQGHERARAGRDDERRGSAGDSRMSVRREPRVQLLSEPEHAELRRA